jgi:hypothetical protein
MLPMKPFTILDASITLSLSDVSDADHYFPSLLKPQKIRIIELIRGTAGSLILVTNETMPGFLTTYGRDRDDGLPAAAHPGISSFTLPKTPVGAGPFESGFSNLRLACHSATLPKTGLLGNAGTTLISCRQGSDYPFIQEVGADRCVAPLRAVTPTVGFCCKV